MSEQPRRSTRKSAVIASVKIVATELSSAADDSSDFDHTPKRSRRIQKKKEDKNEFKEPTTPKKKIETPSTSTSRRKTPVKKSPVMSPSKSPLKSPSKVTGSNWRFNSLGVPKCPLPCRESQFEEIWGFLNENIANRSSRCMYVSGVPGTGKTVIVQSVVNTLKKYATERKKHLQFQYVYINGLSLGSPDKIWKRFYQELNAGKLLKDKKKLNSVLALKKLNSHFETKGRLPVVLVVDELDQILDKKQSILYQLLEWSAQPSAMFSFIAIFNTMSLPENGLVMRNVSRIGLIRCIFPPYSYDQLQTIITTSLALCKSEKIKDEAIIVLSKKVAAVSGDARRALEIAKRAIEIVETNGGSGVTAVMGAFKEIFSSIKIDTMKNCSELEKTFLRTLSTELQSTGNDETTLISLFSNLCTAAVYDGHSWTKSQFLNASLRLSMMKLIITENEASQSMHKRISLNVPVEDVNFALKAEVL